MKFKAGRFYDFWRGSGWFVSLVTRCGWFAVAIRPIGWRCYAVTPEAKPHCRRWYFGPFEFERAVFNLGEFR